jgi:hypothetical protein
VTAGECQQAYASLSVGRCHESVGADLHQSPIGQVRECKVQDDDDNKLCAVDHIGSIQLVKSSSIVPLVCPTKPW